MPFDASVQKTSLNENTLLSLYPVLQKSDLTDQDLNLSHHREQFLDYWKTLIDLEFKQNLERKQTLKVTDGVTTETIANATKTLKDDIIAQGGNIRTLDSLLQELQRLHGKEKELLFEQLQENNEALKNSLEKANSRITDLEQRLEITLGTENQLQNLLKRKEENNGAVETEGQDKILKLEDEKTKLIQKLNTAENQIKQVSEKAEHLQKEIKVLTDILDNATTEKNLFKEKLARFYFKEQKP
ncbi:Uncharacterized protein APZ42_027727 [Daphnia magna]|uniref:Uncharacterized protein n=1 Tax=Daphnia magna TaxID=35525 RepID=A0A164R4S7_9CRUS|nr:Uncharacterized protein APZ42_027727 [Daphnia magna]